jgi:transcriptional regulator with XRE-family HTH domain
LNDERRVDIKDMPPGERLGVLIEALEMSQSVLARKCGRSPQYVNNIVGRDQGITQDFTQELLAETGVNLNWLFGGAVRTLRDVGEAPEALAEIRRRQNGEGPPH